MIESKYYKVDGVLGLHLDDYIFGGEGMNNKTDLDGDYNGDILSFRVLMGGLSRKFPFGSWDFGKSMTFCSASIENDLLTVSMKIKPLTIEKTRKTVVNDICEEKSGRGLRQHISAGLRSRQQRVCFKSIPQSPWYPIVKDLNEAN